MGLELTAAQWAMATFAVSAASAVSNYANSQAQADAANNAAWSNYYTNQQIMAEQARQIGNEANNEVSERAIQAQVEQARLRAIAGESGIQGNTVDRWYQDSKMQESKDIASIEENRSNKLRQNSLESSALATRTAGTVANNDAKRTSELGAALQIAGAGLSAHNEYKRKP